MSKISKKLAASLSTALFIFLNIGIVVYAAETPPDFENITVEKAANPSPPNEDDSPPKLTISQPGSEDIILEAKAYPKGFNPLTSKTQITYKLSKAAKIDIKIVDLSGAEIIKIVDDKELEKGEWFVFWEGTKDNSPTGQIVEIGTYKYIINAKDTESGELLDTAEGELNIVYELSNSNPGNPAKPVNTLPPQQNGGGSANAAGTIALQKATTGKTSETGPGVLIYFLFPIGGLLYSKIRTP